MSPPEATIVIPARSASTRLPRKLLLRETGKSVLQHTYENACRSRLAKQILIAAADEEILRDARSFSADCVLTDPHAASGTDRVAEVARALTASSLIVNLQADEPELAPQHIDSLILALSADLEVDISTLAAPISAPTALYDPATVKVVFDQTFRAMYFSRSCIPCLRDRPFTFRQDRPSHYQHIGIYGYRRETLLQFADMSVSSLEEHEKLEQLRALENGLRLKVVCVDEATRGIDTEADYRDFVKRMATSRAGNGHADFALDLKLVPP